MPGQAGGSRFNEFARLWAEAGHEVTVIAGNLSYVTGEVPDNCKGRWTSREVDGPVTVWRCNVPASYGRSYLGRMWAFFGFTLSSATAALRVPRPDVVIATSPPLVTAIPAWLIARFRGRHIPFIFEIRDLWPESAITTHVLRRKSLLTKMLFALERWACRIADLINVLTPAFRDDLIKRSLAQTEKVVFVPNGADPDFFRPGPRNNAVRREYGWGDRFVVMYTGQHGRANAVGQLLDAAGLLGDRPDVLIACVGNGPEHSGLREEARRRNLSNIFFCGSQPKERMPDFVNACDVGAAVLQNNPTFLTVYPNKVFDYMSCERPTLLAIDGVARQLVCDEARAGVFAEPENADSLATAIRRLADDPEGRREMGRRGREWILANATRQMLAIRYLDIMKELVVGMKQQGWTVGVKRILDVLVAGPGLVLLSPVLLIIALAIRITMGRPVCFRQERPGLNARPFHLFKFRTMRDDRDNSGRFLSDEQRLTGLGRFLRSTSLDELPQLWNVLRGELSLVGPRPLLMQYLDRYTPMQARRHEVLPGITGWAQVNGRNAVNWDQKFGCDVWYVDNWSLRLDLAILSRTLWQVVKREGISRDGHATMPEFLGRGEPQV